MKTISIILLTCLTISSFAQNEEAFGDSLFNALQNEETAWKDWFITLEEYHRLIDRQDLSKFDKDEFKISINESYENVLAEFESSMKELQQQYKSDQDENVDITLDRVATEEVEGVKRVYYFRLFVTYQWEKKTDKYVLESQAAFIGNQWILMEPLLEYYE